MTKSDLIVYLDAPIAMELLGVSGDAARNNIRPIVSELQNIGVQVRVLGISLGEISRNLGAVLNETNRTGPTAKALAQGNVLEPYVRSVADDPERFLEEFRVGVTHRTLDQIPNETSYFDDERYEELFGRLTFQQNIVAREHDTTTATLIMRMRKGRGTRDVFEAKFVLLTRNGVFAQMSRRVCIDLAAMNPKNVPPVIHRRVIATAVWLRTGINENSENIPRRQLLASCERVLSIRPGVVKAVKKFSEELNEEKAKQLNLLLSQNRSVQMLMDKTLGVSRVVSSENISMIFDEMLEPYLSDQRQEYEEKIKGLTSQEQGKTRKHKQLAIAADEKKEKAEAELTLRGVEDMEALKGVARDVEVQIKIRKKIYFTGSMLLAAFFSVPAFGFLDLSDSFRWIFGISSVLLAYLTISGSKLIRIKPEESNCLKLFNNTAKKRSLDKKLSRFVVSWEHEKFTITARVKEIDKLDLI